MTLQVSGAFKDSVTGIRLPFTGVSDVLDGTAVEVESANEYGVNDAGASGTPRAAPSWRMRSSSALLSSHSIVRCLIIEVIAVFTWTS